MRKFFWTLIIVVIVLTIMVIIAGIVAHFRLNKRVANETPAGPTTSENQPLSVAPVVIQNFAFNPPVIYIKKGETITWTNRDSTTHNVVFDNNKATPLLQPGQSAGLVFETAGSFRYYCAPHPWMQGAVVVQE